MNGYSINGRIKEREKVFIKIHVAAVNIKTKKIVLMNVTKENVPDGKMLKELVGEVVSKNNNIQKVLADDGAYDSKDNFKYLDELKIILVIKVRKNSSIKNNTNCTPRKLSVLEQFKDIKRWWKKKYGYGMQRWMTESAFSSIKRMFGEHVYIIFKMEQHCKWIDVKSIYL